MSRAVVLLFSAISYSIFLATFLYLVCFVGDLPLAPVTVDRGPSAPTAIAVAGNLVLILLFAVQHSVMARPGFKKAWTRLIPAVAERSFYVLAASAMLILMFALWRPIPQTAWDLSGTILELPLLLLFAAGWVIVLVSTFLINHFELFGLQQAWLNLRGRRAADPQLRQPLFYRWVAHPLYSGFFIAFWSTPTMSYGHLLLATGMSVFMLVAIRYEERDLTSLFGDDYRRYRSKVGMLVPRVGGMASAEDARSSRGLGESS